MSEAKIKDVEKRTRELEEAVKFLTYRTWHLLGLIIAAGIALIIIAQ